MQPFIRLVSVPASLPLINVDTDMIIPKQFLRTIRRTGLAAGLFYELRFDESGNPRPDFVLNTPPYDSSRILLAGENFGCGSSREHAPWALLDFGIRCVIAPSFGDIFHSNSLKNGLLPVRLPQTAIDILSGAGERGQEIAVDLESRTVSCDGAVFPFVMDEMSRNNLLKGLDEIGETLEKEREIKAYEEKRKEKFPWLA